MSPFRAALEAAFPDARLLEEGESYAAAERAGGRVSLHEHPEGVIAVRYRLVYDGAAEGRDAAEALAGLGSVAERPSPTETASDWMYTDATQLPLFAESP